jgi:catalase
MLATLGLPAPSTAQAVADEPVTVQLVDSLEAVFGRHASTRRSHAKGFCAAGTWTANGAGAALSTAASLEAGLSAPVIARFSTGGGNPAAPDNAPTVRGLAFSIELPGGEPHEFVLLNTPVFTARTPESFVRFLRVRAPDPATRQMNTAAIAAANAENPDWAPQMAYLRDTAPPASYATAPYFGINSFVVVDRAGMRRHVRWIFEPVAGRVGLTAEERTARGPQFLEAELRERLARGPAEWRVLLQLPEPGDPLTDAVSAWPETRQTVEVGRLSIAAVDPAGAKGECGGRLFNPTLLPAGIEPSDDPILAVRAEVYAISLSRRSQ